MVQKTGAGSNMVAVKGGAGMVRTLLRNAKTKQGPIQELFCSEGARGIWPLVNDCYVDSRKVTVLLWRAFVGSLVTLGGVAMGAFPGLLRDSWQAGPNLQKQQLRMTLKVCGVFFLLAVLGVQGCKDFCKPIGDCLEGTTYSFYIQAWYICALREGLPCECWLLPGCGHITLELQQVRTDSQAPSFSPTLFFVSGENSFPLLIFERVCCFPGSTFQLFEPCLPEPGVWKSIAREWPMDMNRWTPGDIDFVTC